MATFVLVPGGMCGGWLWQRLIPLLRAAGHEAHPITLTGLGDRVHLASPLVDLDTHVTDLVNLLVYEDLREVIMLGHSYAGMVIAGAADRAPERVSRLVYLDALAPVDGESMLDLRPEMGRPGQDELDELGRRRIPFSLEETREFLPDLAEEDITWFYERLTPQPATSYAQPIRLGNAAAAIPRAYILCRRNWSEPPPLPADILRARTEPGWDYREMDTDHVPMVARPTELTELLLDLT